MNNKQFESDIIPLATKIYPFVARIVGANDAEDCIQEIFCKIWENRKKLKQVTNIGGYTYKIAYNYCINHIKKRPIQIPLEQVIESANTNISDDKKEKYTFILKEINNLKEPIKSIIIFRDLDGLEYSEIEELTNLSQPNIRMILSRGRKIIRQKYLETQKTEENAQINYSVFNY